VTVQEHERGRVQLGQNDCLRGEKEIPKENSNLSYLHNIHKMRPFIKYESHIIVPSQFPVYCISSDLAAHCHQTNTQHTSVTVPQKGSAAKGFYETCLAGMPPRESCVRNARAAQIAAMGGGTVVNPSSPCKTFSNVLV
jgi:hypothetical protein